MRPGGHRSLTSDRLAAAGRPATRGGRRRRRQARHQRERTGHYQAWRDGKAADPTGERAFASVMGQTPAEANEAWQTWVMRQ